MRTSSLSSLCAGALIAAAPLAFASNAAPEGATSSNTATNQTASTANTQLTEARAQALKSAKFSLGQAIDTAQRTHGKAFFAQFELRHAKPYYLLKTFQNREEWVGLIDADSGQVVGSGRTYPQSKLTPEQVRDMHTLQNVGTSLQQAVRDAEQHESGAKVLQASLLTSPKGNATYRLSLVQNGHMRVAMINPHSGRFE